MKKERTFTVSMRDVRTKELESMLHHVPESKLLEEVLAITTDTKHAKKYAEVTENRD